MTDTAIHTAEKQLPPKRYPDRGRRLRNEPRVPTPALNAWRRELARGVRTIRTFDPLWAAACEDMAAVEALANGQDDAVRRHQKEARRILKQACESRAP